MDKKTVPANEPRNESIFGKVCVTLDAPGPRAQPIQPNAPIIVPAFDSSLIIIIRNDNFHPRPSPFGRLLPNNKNGRTQRSLASVRCCVMLGVETEHSFD